MYKKRLKKWNIRKRGYRKSQPSTNASTPVPLLEDMGEDDAEVEVISRANTSPPPPVAPAQLSTPEPYAGLEVVLRSVYSWSQGKLETHCIRSDPMSRYLANPNQPPIQDSRTMYRTFELVFDLWRHGKGNLAGMAARRGFYVLEYVLTDDHPDLVWHILDTIYDMVVSGHIQLLSIFLEHATILAHRHLPPQHPLQRILLQLRGCDYQTDQGRRFVCHLLRQAWLQNVDVLAEQIGTLAPQHLWLYEQLIWDGRTGLRKNSGLERRRGGMTAALRKLIASQGPNSGAGPDSERLRMEALMLEFTQMDIGDKQKAEQLAGELLEHTRESGDVTVARSAARFHAYARKMLARIHEERREWDAAERNLRWAVAKREAAHGANTDLRVVRDMWVLASHFRRTGRPAEADKVVQDAIDRAARYLEDVHGRLSGWVDRGIGIKE